MKGKEGNKRSSRCLLLSAMLRKQGKPQPCHLSSSSLNSGANSVTIKQYCPIIFLGYSASARIL